MYLDKESRPEIPLELADEGPELPGLPKCPCGGVFSASARPKCPFCKAHLHGHFNLGIPMLRAADGNSDDSRSPLIVPGAFLIEVCGPDDLPEWRFWGFLFLAFLADSAQVICIGSGKLFVRILSMLSLRPMPYILSPKRMTQCGVIGLFLLVSLLLGIINILL